MILCGNALLSATGRRDVRKMMPAYLNRRSRRSRLTVQLALMFLQFDTDQALRGSHRIIARQNVLYFVRRQSDVLNLMFPEDFQWNVICLGSHILSLSLAENDVSSWCFGLNGRSIFAHRNDAVRMYNLSVPTLWTRNLYCWWLFGLRFSKNLYVHATFALPDCDFPDHHSPFDNRPITA